MVIFQDVFTEIAALILIAAVIGGLMMRMRQPLIVAFIAAGILAGPSFLGWVRSADQVDLLAKIGISLLLFVVGLKLDLNQIRTMGPVSLATGLGQIIFTSSIGYFIALALGLSPIASLYVAVALTFSSTIIIVKLLSDKREIDSLHGRIAVGFLIVQDIVVILVMIGLSTLGAVDQNFVFSSVIIVVLLKTILFLAGIVLLVRFVFPDLLKQLSRSYELLILFSIAWAVSLAAMSDYLGLSKEIGAFLAGISLASTPYREAIGARLVSLRDFLLLFFFIDLGAQLDISALGSYIIPSIILSLFVLIGNPLIVVVIMGHMGYSKRTGFLAGLTVAQISEFSLIFAALGIELGHIDTNIMGIITFVGMITIGLSTYMIIYSHTLYDWLATWLSKFERRDPYREHIDDCNVNAAGIEMILFGLGRYGGNLANNLNQKNKQVLCIDFDPEAVSTWLKRGLLTQYGDVEDSQFLATLPLNQSQWVISTLHQRKINLMLLKSLHEMGYEGKVALTAHTNEDAAILEQAGADMLLLPFADGADKAAERLLSFRVQ